MGKVETKPDLHQALEDFENLLETPIIPGELPEWCQSAQSNCVTVQESLLKKLKDHVSIYKQIELEDPSLESHVLTMRAEDERLRTESEHFLSEFTRAAATAEIAEPNEGLVEQLAGEIADRAIQFIIAIRKQEHAVATWYIEALERDRGDKD
ncbi:hypothetical protein LOC68_08725 [Blastopirellula sp. JC732]|uniref:Uncharacterized protein n=1 Tax=Blastopirellula sediminis TaxID=2894196 RepID=A0A9X1MM88_9BACT|nr:hypothetical protein [Blastopirellula sediminis]MCC9608746.1 hypothetical protein [Blastopirellula sediminis]MCC9628477.1 hypothetical protein [Blastopirellula sediminis]